MKKTFTIIALITAVIASSLNAEDTKITADRSAAGVADKLLNAYDWDNSGALDELEMCAAVAYLEVVRPFRVYSDPSLGRDPVSIPAPKVAVNLVNIFDLDENYQLEEEELTMALSGLRTRVINNRGLFALAD